MFSSRMNAKRDLLLEAGQIRLSQQRTDTRAYADARVCCKAAAALDLTIEARDKHGETLSAIVHGAKIDRYRNQANRRCARVLERDAGLKAAGADRLFVATERYLERVDDATEVNDRLTEIAAAAPTQIASGAFPARGVVEDRFMRQLMAREKSREEDALLGQMPDVPVHL
jgi:hypothetical protein